MISMGNRSTVLTINRSYSLFHCREDMCAFFRMLQKRKIFMPNIDPWSRKNIQTDCPTNCGMSLHRTTNNMTTWLIWSVSHHHHHRLQLMTNLVIQHCHTKTPKAVEILKAQWTQKCTSFSSSEPSNLYSIILFQWCHILIWYLLSQNYPYLFQTSSYILTI